MFRTLNCHRTNVSKLLLERGLTTSSGETAHAVKIIRQKSRTLPKTTSEIQQKMRDDFLRREAEWEAMVDLAKLNEEEKLIHQCHKEAVKGSLLIHFFHLFNSFMNQY